MIIVIQDVQITLDASIPIRTIAQLDALIDLGVRDFYVVHDYRPYCHSYDSRHISIDHRQATGEHVCYGSTPAMKDFQRLPTVGNIYYLQSIWLSDCNVGNGGYNNHNLFMSKEGAEAYKAHLLRGGEHYPQAPHKNA